MKKFVLRFISALILGGLIYSIFIVLPQFETKKKGPLYDEDVKKAQEVVICDVVKHSCSYFDKIQDSGNVKVVISAGNNPIKGLEVDIASKPGFPQYYVKLTDKQGVALFENLPSGKYTIYFNGVNFPKEYGDSPTVPVEITKDKTKEIYVPLAQ